MAGVPLFKDRPQEVDGSQQQGKAEACPSGEGRKARDRKPDDCHEEKHRKTNVQADAQDAQNHGRATWLLMWRWLRLRRGLGRIVSLHALQRSLGRRHFYPDSAVCGPNQPNG
jgi:hypothetical protein